MIHAEEVQAARRRPLPATRGCGPFSSILSASYGRSVELLGLIAALSLLALPILIAIDVFIRVLGIGSIKWVVDVSEYLLYVSTFLGAPWLMRLGLHVRVDVLLAALPRMPARRLEQTIDLFCIGICCVLAYYGLLAAIDAWQLDLKQYKALTVPDWPFHAVFVFTMSLLAIEFVRRLMRPEEALDTHDAEVGL
jgi:TRAP-type C4-dicarboxylate transport system permease small subunit